jgi:hypothetical protein
VDDILQRTALDALNSGEYCGGGVVVNPDSPLQWFSQLVLDLWNWLSRKLLLAAGCFVYCRRDAFETVGGFSEKVYASEEIWLSLALASWGKKNSQKFLIIENPPIITSMRKLEWYSQRQLFLLSVPIVLCPPLIFFRRLCTHWYRR